VYKADKGNAFFAVVQKLLKKEAVFGEVKSKK
jgi:hypothetical protein